MKIGIFKSHEYEINICCEIIGIINTVLSRYGTFLLNIKDKNDFKSEHIADDEAIKKIKEYFFSNNVQANVFFEGSDPYLCKTHPKIALFIDPIDGSLNRDLGVGDPGIVIAFAKNHDEIRFKDIYGGCVYGIHSKNIYVSFDNETHFYQNHNSDPIKIMCDQAVIELKDVILYYNDGYGQHFSKSTFKKAGSLPLFVKHRNAFDNTAMEICQICRGAAHARVEARSVIVNEKLKGSDHANILPAFAIGNGSGLLVTDLKGNSLNNEIIDLDKVCDFICCNNESILLQIIDIISNNINILYQYIKE